MLSLRLRTYRQLLHLNPIEDDSIQAYNQRWREAQDTAQSLFEELDSASHTHEEQTEILLTIFVLLQVGYRNDTLFTRAVEATYNLLETHLEQPILKRKFGVANYKLSIIN